MGPPLSLDKAVVGKDLNDAHSWRSFRSVHNIVRMKLMVAAMYMFDGWSIGSFL